MFSDTTTNWEIQGCVRVWLLRKGWTNSLSWKRELGIILSYKLAVFYRNKRRKKVKANRSSLHTILSEWQFGLVSLNDNRLKSPSCRDLCKPFVHMKWIAAYTNELRKIIFIFSTTDIYIYIYILRCLISKSVMTQI